MSRLFACLLVLLLNGAALRAEEATTVVLRPGLDQAHIDAMMAAARASGRPVTIRWDDAPAKAAAAQVTSSPASAPSGEMEMADMFRVGFQARLQGLSRLGDLRDAFAARWAANRNGDTADALWRIVATILLATAAAIAARRGAVAFGRRHPGHARGNDVLDRTRASLRGLLADLLALGAFLAVGYGALMRLLPAPDLARTVAATSLSAGIGVLVYAAAGRFLLAPGRPERRLLPLPNVEWHYGMLLLYAVLGQAATWSVVVALAGGGAPETVEAWFLIPATIITLVKIYYFWRGRHDIATMLMPRHEGTAPGLMRRFAAHATPWLLLGVGVAIWLIGNVAAGSPDGGAHWSRAAGATQIIAVMLPILALGIESLARAYIERHHTLDGVSPGRLAVAATVRTLLAGGIWVVGILVIARIWDTFLRDPAAIAAVRGLVRISAALVAGWAIWTFLRAYFDAHAPKPRQAGPGGDEEAEPHVQTRLATVLPIVRDLALGATVAITGLVALSSLGVDIAPLLAGFGVIGLAISFGSQALVRDVVSGIFFMADDAFRVGEYIDTGRLKGTVEKITLRSVQLRHQNGQIHTVPFGQLQAITNFSRDWATMKFSIRLDREADIEKARKTIKRVGAEMQADPETGPEFIQPLKMQGVQEITDSAIVVRCKFTSTPAKPTWLQREALKRIHRALTEAGVPFASNAVSFRNGDANREGAAASLAAAPPQPLQGAA